MCFLNCTTWCSQKLYQLISHDEEFERSLKGVNNSSGTLNFGIFAHSITLILEFPYFISKTGGFG